MQNRPPKTLCFIEYLKKFNSYNFKLYFKSVLFVRKQQLRSVRDANFFFYLFLFLLTINLKLITVHVEIKIMNKEAATKRSALLHAQRPINDFPNM